MTIVPFDVLYRRLAHLLFVFCLSAGFATSAQATVMVELPLDDLIRHADLVIQGTVMRTGTRVHSPRAAEALLEPRTHVWIKVNEVLAGDAPANGLVHLWEPGGRYGDVQTTVAGAPHYERGESVVVFLRRDPDNQGLYRTLEMSQGKYKVLPNAVDGGRVAIRDLSDVSIVRWRRKSMEVGPPSTQKPIALTTLSARVRELKLKPEVSKKVPR